MNYGYDRYYKDNFYKEVEDTFNLTKFYYRFRSLIIYSTILKKETHDDSSILNDENIKKFLLFNYENNIITIFFVKTCQMFFILC